jgi:hypothetical protein
VATTERPKRSPPAWRVVAGVRELTVAAHTRGEARALAKRALGMPPRWRLPAWVRVERIKE